MTIMRRSLWLPSMSPSVKSHQSLVELFRPRSMVRTLPPLLRLRLRLTQLLLQLLPLLCSAFMHLGTSVTGRPAALRLEGLKFRIPLIPSPHVVSMAASGASSTGAFSQAFADFASATGLDLVTAPAMSSPAPTASPRRAQRATPSSPCRATRQVSSRVHHHRLRLGRPTWAISTATTWACRRDRSLPRRPRRLRHLCWCPHRQLRVQRPSSGRANLDRRRSPRRGITGTPRR